MCNYNYSPKGRIWVGWDANTVKLEVLGVSRQFITVRMRNLDKAFTFEVSFVYGYHTIVDRKKLWMELKRQGHQN